MKATGIVRRIDNLGRIVIPKEIRKTLRIKEGEALEIFTDREGEVILKKYSPIEELGEYAMQYAEAVHQNMGHSILITDTDQIIAGAGAGKREAMNQSISKGFEKLLEQREQKKLCKGERNYTDIYHAMQIDLETYLFTPIIHEGNVIGSIVVVPKNQKYKIGEVEMKVAAVGAYYLSNQMS